MQFPVNQGHQLFERALVSVSPTAQLRYIIATRGHQNQECPMTIPNETRKKKVSGHDSFLS